MSAVSIIIPMYKVEKYLHRCLDSVKNQTFKDWTAICVDDGSPDNSGEIAEEYAKKDERFIVVHKENGGLSDARNYGMKYANGKYIMFLDSDDFIHPQTVEIAHNIAEQNNSDIVSFKYNRFYRVQLKIYHILHLDVHNVAPIDIRKKYRLNKIKSHTSSDAFEYATEQTHNAFNKNRKWLIKHCQVWKNLYKRTLISETPFIKGILFEDFPWWSEILLKKPVVTSVPLSLYYYMPNFGGIMLSSNQLKIMQGLCAGIKISFKSYKDRADNKQMQQWQTKFMWFFVNWAFRKLKYLTTESEIKIAYNEFADMKNLGVFDYVPKKWCGLYKKINTFLNH